MKKIGVIGAGSMGRGIAQHAAVYGLEVVLVDVNETTLIEAFAFNTKMINRLAEKKSISDLDAKSAISRIYCSSDMTALEKCELIIEAVVEKIEVKKSIFEKLETIVSPQAILASNTSSLSITQIAAVLKNPERFIGLHFFNPVPLMKLVEIIPAIQTDTTYIDICYNVMLTWEKQPVLAKDTPGFIVNKVARPFYSEALRIYDEGIANFSTIDSAMTNLGGFKMGPFTLMDFIGNDVNYAVTESVFQSFYFDPRYKPSFTQKRLSEAGWLGRKAGKGYYTYSDGVANEEVIEKEIQVSIYMRILVMLINEAADTVHMGIATIIDVDTAVQFGVNYPKGLLKWADEIGLETIVTEIDKLYDMYREDRYRCSALLRRMLAKRENFYHA